LITEKELAEIAQREGLAQANLRLALSDRLVDHVAQHAFDRRYGARPLQRTLERFVVTPLARYLVENPGIRDAEIHIDVDPNGTVVFAVT
jgi:ATP-dependent Clp protease ATP-binding subunit ClpA